MIEKINEFKGEFRFLSNFWPCKVCLDNVEYPSVECAYQAAKSLDPNVRKFFLNASSAQAKQLGKMIAIRKDWNEVKVPIMYNLVWQKFSNDETLRQKLLQTGSAELIEGNTWGDTFWGVDMRSGNGKNILGKILMETRANL